MVRAGERSAAANRVQRSCEDLGALLCRCSDGLTVFSCYLHLSLIKLTAQSHVTLAAILKARCDAVWWLFLLC